jgi:predicted nucleotidyltransferase
MTVSRQEIQAFAGEIARRFQPERIILFGSYAWGNPDNDSDVDVLVVMPLTGSHVDKAVEVSLKVPHKFALDLLVRDPDVLARREALNDWFLKEIVEQGEVLYESAYA